MRTKIISKKSSKQTSAKANTNAWFEYLSIGEYYEFHTYCTKEEWQQIGLDKVFAKGQKPRNKSRNNVAL